MTSRSAHPLARIEQALRARVLRPARPLRRQARALWDLRVLPRRVALFYWRAQRRARQAADPWGPDAAARPHELAALIDLARGRMVVAELGTAAGWTAIALALAQPGRRVMTVDPVEHTRALYLALVPAEVAGRVHFVTGEGAGAAVLSSAPVELLFIDSSHAHAEIVAEFSAWRERLAPGAIVAFHDYRHPDFPGVQSAISQLGLTGEATGATFVWRAPERPAVSPQQRL